MPIVITDKVAASTGLDCHDPLAVALSAVSHSPVVHGIAWDAGPMVRNAW